MVRRLTVAAGRNAGPRGCNVFRAYAAVAASKKGVSPRVGALRPFVSGIRAHTACPVAGKVAAPLEAGTTACKPRGRPNPCSPPILARRLRPIRQDSRAIASSGLLSRRAALPVRLLAAALRIAYIPYTAADSAQNYVTPADFRPFGQKSAGNKHINGVSAHLTEFTASNI